MTKSVTATQESDKVSINVYLTTSVKHKQALKSKGVSWLKVSKNLHPTLWHYSNPNNIQKKTKHSLIFSPWHNLRSVSTERSSGWSFVGQRLEFQPTQGSTAWRKADTHKVQILCLSSGVPKAWKTLSGNQTLPQFGKVLSWSKWQIWS